MRTDDFTQSDGPFTPPPATSTSPPIWELVVADMQKRDQHGEEKYGKRLQAHNGRDALVDLYQELLDAAVYTRQLLFEKYGK